MNMKITLEFDSAEAAAEALARLAGKPTPETPAKPARASRGKGSQAKKAEEAPPPAPAPDPAAEPPVDREALRDLIIDYAKQTSRDKAVGQLELISGGYNRLDEVPADLLPKVHKHFASLAAALAETLDV